MKAHRYILIISFMISIISFILILIIPNKGKTFQIFLAFLGSSFISFMLELPVYLLHNRNNSNLLYYSLLDLKANTSIFINIINNTTNKSQLVSDKFYEAFINPISFALNNYRSLDSGFVISKKKALLYSKSFNNLTNALSNLKQASYTFDISFYNKKINKLQNKENVTITSKEMIKEYMLLKNSCENIIKIIDDSALRLFSKNKYKEWIINNEVIINNKQNYNTSQMNNN